MLVGRGRGRAELIEKLLRDFDGANPLLTKDGSTDISSLLSRPGEDPFKLNCKERKIRSQY
ncbi:uncharacterized protein N7518_004021 [Penicillium psychrosexuale]|uniref:uncharacterized protein n=1 Tax=Penicillium psychrosexuale TaxID=1002107 RepID=UPI002544E6EA|nr:uncharacterized protein N7518_004021 [Penicillium psychrosexuale]KAJ5795481.1 hypothetical protein N7518_004021 [Penicillium psychrosexuale]